MRYNYRVLTVSSGHKAFADVFFAVFFPGQEKHAVSAGERLRSASED